MFNTGVTVAPPTGGTVGPWISKYTSSAPEDGWMVVNGTRTF